MKKAIICFQHPANHHYVGGVSTLINGYAANKEIFEKNGIDIDLYNYQPKGLAAKVKNSKIRNVLNGLGQAREAKSVVRDAENTVFHIHTSREFLFMKDVKLAKYIKKKKRGLRVMMTVHVGDISTVYNRIGFFKKKSIRILNKYVDRIFFLGQTIRQQFTEAGLKSEKCSVLYNFHTYGDLPFQKNDQDQNSEIKLVFIGAIHREKGIMDLLSAVKEIDSNLRLDICGLVTDRSIEESFKNAVNGDARFFERGYVKGDEKKEILKNADVLILPSYHEGLPVVILEALAGGCAIISTTVGATPELLTDENALWVNAGDSASLREAILKLISDRKMLRGMQEKNYALGKKYDTEHHIETLCAYYHGTLTP